MVSLARLLLSFLLLVHLAILASSQLQRFGHIGARQLCSNVSFNLCDDPLWTGGVAIVLLAAFVWIEWGLWVGKRGARTPEEISNSPKVVGGSYPPNRPSRIWISGQLRIRPRPAQNPDSKEEHFDVLAGDRVVGHIYRYDSSQRDWFWTLPPDESSRLPIRLGKADSFEEAERALRHAWQSRFL